MIGDFIIKLKETLEKVNFLYKQNSRTQNVEYD